MTSFIALLRGINVGGNKKVAMAELREHLSSVGYAGVRTLLQSGNVVFGAEGKNSKQLERELEVEVERRFGFKVDCFVRTAQEWEAVVEGNPFPKEAHDDPGHVLVIFMKEAVKVEAMANVQRDWPGPEYFETRGREVYAVFPSGVGNSKLIVNPNWKKLAGQGTGRNWNTIVKLASLVKK